MEGPRQEPRNAQSERRFAEQHDRADETPVEIGLHAEVPLEINMTDEPGGDPYNHTGRFKRMFR